MIKPADNVATMSVARVWNDRGTLLNNPSRISRRIPSDRINSGIKELIPFVISSNDADKSVTISMDLRLSLFQR